MRVKYLYKQKYQLCVHAGIFIVYRLIPILANTIKKNYNK